MIITYWKGVFVVDKASTPQERSALKKVGFELHEPSVCPMDKHCKACRAGVGSRYWTSRVTSATRLRSVCNKLALDAMNGHLEKLAKSRATTSDINVPAPPGLSFMPYQKAGIAYHLAHKDSYNGDDMGLGKDQVLTAKILTPAGWTTMGEIKKGDLVVGSDGHSYPVTGVYPQGWRNVFRVTFQDGANTECGEEHLWEVNTPLRHHRGCTPKILSTRQIMNIGLREKNNNSRHFVRLAKPRDFSKKPLDVDPYVMGYLLGNGGLSQTSVRVTIPPEYMWTTKQNRVALLQGLIDSDGHVSPIDGNIEYSSSSPQLAKDVQQLIWSLGGIARIRPKKTNRRMSYRMSVILPNDVVPCRLTRKLAHHKKRTKYPPCRSIVKIEPVGLKETQCIAVDSPDHLYVTDDFILTHNTIQALGVVSSLRVSNPRLNTLVLCPRTLTFNWKNEAEKWLLDIPGVGKPEIVIPTSGNFEVPRRDNLFVITTYEKCTGDTLLTDSLKRVWDVLIPDEAHALKNWEAQRTKAVLGQEGLMQRAHRTVFLSGTPIENYPKEIWTIAAAICPAKFGSWSEYAKRYCGIHREGGRLVDTGATNLAELQQRLRTSFMIRRLKSDVLKELPPKRRQLIVLGDSKVDWSQDPDFKRWHDLYEKDYEAKLAALEAAKTEEEYAKAARALDAFTGIAFEDMSDMRHRTAVAKLPACIEYIDKVLETNIEKLVIFAHHQDVLAELALHYGAQAVSLHGQTTQKAREAAVKRFREGDARIFIGGLKAAGVGLNLYEASTVIFIEIDWNPAKLTQAEDRLCRFGQKKMVHVIHLVLAGTLDVNMVQRVMAKQAVVDKALNQKPEQGIKLSPQTVMAFRC